MPEMVSTSQCSSLEDEICNGCKHDDEFLIDGIGCLIQAHCEFYGDYPDEWVSGKCSKWEA